MPRDAPQLLLTLEHHDLPGAKAGELGRGGEAGRAAADHGDVDALRRAHELRSERLARDPGAAEEPLAAPHQHPCASPQSIEVGGGIGLVAASRISPRVTRSQKQIDLAVGRVGGNPPRVGERPRGGLPDVGHVDTGKAIGALAQLEAGAASSSRIHSAIAIDAVRPVERIPPAHA